MTTTDETTTGKRETVYLAGGCFWGMQEILREIPGVIETDVGYAGGDVQDATYRSHDGHAETVRVVFDPAQLPFEELRGTAQPTQWIFHFMGELTNDAAAHALLRKQLGFLTYLPVSLGIEKLQQQPRIRAVQRRHTTVHDDLAITDACC